MPRRKPTPQKRLVADAREIVRVCAGISIRLAARRITRFLEQHMVDAGLSIALFGLMAHIAAAEDDTIGVLAARSGLDQSTLSRHLRDLERAGLVEITIDKEDMRRRAVWLTEAGARRLEAATVAWRKAHDDLSRIIDPGRVRRITSATAALPGPKNR
jgi:DNA-binding MarR family transcriptional regulator